MPASSAAFAPGGAVLTAELLKAKGLLYPCYETAEELERRKKIALSRGKPPVYDRASLSLTEDERNKLEAEQAITGGLLFRCLLEGLCHV